MRYVGLLISSHVQIKLIPRKDMRDTLEADFQLFFIAANSSSFYYSLIRILELYTVMDFETLLAVGVIRGVVLVKTTPFCAWDRSPVGHPFILVFN